MKRKKYGINYLFQKKKENEEKLRPLIDQHQNLKFSKGSDREKKINQ